jgi:hypothetical protein
VAYAHDQDLIRSGYVPHQMTISEKEGRRWMVEATVNGKAGVFVVSTVAYSVVDVPFADGAHISTVPTDEKFGGPKGSSGVVRKSALPLSFAIDGQQTKTIIPNVYDVFAYVSEVRPTAQLSHSVGFLGADFMLANHAVIDFGTNTLFLKP